MNVCRQHTAPTTPGLVEIKMAYDPGNLFRSNRNIVA